MGHVSQVRTQASVNCDAAPMADPFGSGFHEREPRVIEKRDQIFTNALSLDDSRADGRLRWTSVGSQWRAFMAKTL